MSAGDGLVFISPTEPPTLKQIGKVSSLPEKHGVDVLWASQRLKGLVGVQRKEIKDLVASVQDGRLAKEVGQMSRLSLAVLVVEGRPRWSTEGELLVDKWTKWNLNSHRNLLRSIQEKGIWIEATDDINDTAMSVLSLKRWVEREHKALNTRPKPRGAWGVATDKDWCIHLLQSFPGIGPIQAAAILDHFGKVPMVWEVDAKELQKVPGIGKVRAESLVKALKSV